jgi:tetratricopeptide (TPR) repeat protein
VTIGPYDYQTDRKMVTFIEGNHFQPQVEALVGGVSGPVGAELNFMLLHIPNHPRVLLALVRYGEKQKWVPAPGLQFSYECYFDRAIRFRPDDPMVRMIYATYLNKFSRASEALKQLAYAADVAKEDAFAHYNVGLIYLDMKQYELAAAEARKAEALGFQRPELRERLRAAGKWREEAAADGSSGVERSKP